MVNQVATDVVGIILAAGEGIRLHPLTEDIPKPLIQIGGRPLLEYSIAFLKKLGINKIIVVGGYRFKQVKEYIDSHHSDIVLVENTNYKNDSLSSFSCALERILPGKGILQMDVDFIYPADFQENIKILLRKERICFACASPSKSIPRDMVKILSDSSGAITDMRKEILQTSNPYGYIGMFYCPAIKVPLLTRFVNDALSSAIGGKTKVWSMLADFAKSSPEEVYIADIGAFPCVEVDTPVEKNAAELYIEANKEGIGSYFK